MRLVEVVEAPAQRQGRGRDRRRRRAGGSARSPCVCGVCDGFIGNRILAHWRPIVDMMVEDGATPQGVDAALERFGFAMGPYRGRRPRRPRHRLGAAQAPRADAATPTRATPERSPTSFASSAASARRPAPAGIATPTARKAVDPAVTELIEKVRARRRAPAPRVSRRDDPAAGARGDRQRGREGAQRRRSRVAPLDIDVVLINGYGYPAWRGGPMFEADALGLGKCSPTSRRRTPSPARAMSRRRCCAISREAAGASPIWRRARRRARR